MFSPSNVLAFTPPVKTPSRSRDPCRWFTPAWAAEALYDLHFRATGPRDLIWEPFTGDGRMLASVPATVPAFGSELDPVLADLARRRTGREVICGDFREVPLPSGITGIFSNPPFHLDLIHDLLDRAAHILPEAGRAALLLPAYIIQTPKNVLRWNRHFTVAQDALPRALFPGLRCPLIYACFTRSVQPTLVGFQLYQAFHELQQLPAAMRKSLAENIDGPRSVWLRFAIERLQALGGQASLRAIFSSVGHRRPTANTHWKAQLRKVYRNPAYFVCTDRGRYALKTAA